MQRLTSNLLDFKPNGNPRLRNMGAMQARTLCKADLHGDPEAFEKYRRWTDEYEDGLKLLQRLSFEKERQR